ncbi:hypothetical protein FDV58_27720 [Bradyrhizobium elkanii]|uniref:Uncharacterized protein n=1 Tax=Bradyrhizobium elkanii TaxID=29448 RepID=A0A4U6RSW3_BRAEL|nr:hypothetical protein [Bradyrhizobium elkanii]TKV77994.1 hypothetical protein FDV58_27720 [Bradyrhizobium elkanii]
MPFRPITLDALHRTHSNLLQDGDLNKQMAGVYLAIAVLNEFLGEPWVARFILPGAKPNVLALDETDQLSCAIGHAKIIDLAEVLYNLQFVDGIDNCVERMRSGDIEGSMAELDLGRMLFIHSVEFKYVTPIMRKGYDYDILVKLPNGMFACADAKCKIEGQEFSVNSVENTLKKGRKQFPQDRPAILFVKHPYEWHDDSYALTTLGDIAMKFFRTTERVVSVKYYVQPILRQGGNVTQRLGFKEFSNPRTRFGSDVDWSLFNTPNILAHAWQHIGNFPDGVRE